MRECKRKIQLTWEVNNFPLHMASLRYREDNQVEQASENVVQSLAEGRGICLEL